MPNKVDISTHLSPKVGVLILESWVYLYKGEEPVSHVSHTDSVAASENTRNLEIMMALSLHRNVTTSFLYRCTNTKFYQAPTTTPIHSYTTAQKTHTRTTNKNPYTHPHCTVWVSSHLHRGVENGTRGGLHKA